MENRRNGQRTSIPLTLHLGRGIRHMENEKKAPREMQALPWGLSSHFPRCSLLHEKNRHPRGFLSAKTAISKCAIRGSNPGHPD